MSIRLRGSDPYQVQLAIRSRKAYGVGRQHGSREITDKEMDALPEDARIRTDALALRMEAVRRMDEDRSDR